MKKNPVKIIAAILLLLLTCTNAVEGSAIKERSKNNKEKPLKILAIGDSNGALPEGWVNQLKKIRVNDTVYNMSVSGNTIGFNNNGRQSLNTLLNIRDYMSKAYLALGSIDKIVIMLGTNDCKAVFKDSLAIVPENMIKLISEIRTYARQKKEKPVIYIVSPPPYGPDEMLEEKYRGGMERVLKLNRMLEKVAKNEGVNFINTCDILIPVFRMLSPDGVHLNSVGQKMIALIIQENLKY